jgi:hypothetical protein
MEMGRIVYWAVLEVEEEKRQSLFSFYIRQLPFPFRSKKRKNFPPLFYSRLDGDLQGVVQSRVTWKCSCAIVRRGASHDGDIDATAGNKSEKMEVGLWCCRVEAVAAASTRIWRG